MLEVFKYHLHLQTKGSRGDKARQPPGLSCFGHGYAKPPSFPSSWNQLWPFLLHYCCYWIRGEAATVGCRFRWWAGFELHPQRILSVDLSTSWSLSSFCVDLCWCKAMPRLSLMCSLNWAMLFLNSDPDVDISISAEVGCLDAVWLLNSC